MPVGTPEDFRGLLSANAPLIGEVLPKWSPVTHLKIIKTASAYLARAKSPMDILRCDAQSILQSVCDAVELGLVFTPALGQAYLVPYKGRCTLMIGYRGLMDLVRRAADVSRLDSGIVYQGETFEAVKGDTPRLNHIERFDIARTDDKIVAAYAIAFYPDGGSQFEVLGLSELKKVRAVSPASARGPWQDWLSEMCRKTALRRLAKLLPISAEKAKYIEKAFQIEQSDYGNSPAITPKDRAAALMAKMRGEPEVVDAELVEDETEASGEARAAGAATPETPGERTPPPDSGGGPETTTPSSVPVTPARQRLYDLLRAIAKHRNVTLDDLWIKAAGANLDYIGTIWTLLEVDVPKMTKVAEAQIKKSGIDFKPFVQGGPEHQPLPPDPSRELFREPG
jgi:recombination protein RecT